MSHLLVTGSGRAGTSALMRLFDACGLDTGIDELEYFEGANAGFERYPDGRPLPRVIKSPLLSVGLEDLIDGGFDPTSIEAVILPLRRIDDVAASRIDNFRQGGIDAPGGLWVGFYGPVTVYSRPSDQRRLAAEAVSQLLLTTAEHQIPVITLAFPRFVTDAEYAWRRLSPILGNLDREDFGAAHKTSMRPDLVHGQPGYTRRTLWMLDLRWRLAYLRRALVARVRGERITHG
jgi:hypothetical protein